MVKPGDRKNIVAYLDDAYQVSVTRACKVVGLTKSMYYYLSVKDDTAVIDKLRELSENKPSRGFPYYYRRIRNEGLVWNHKRVKRVYNALRLNLRRKPKRRLPQRIKEPLNVPMSINQTWSMDFMHDMLTNGRKVRVFNIIDDFNREALAIEADYSHSGHSVVSIVGQVIAYRGKPTQIRCDNGPEFLSHKLVDYCKSMNIGLKYIQPGKPTQNAFIERFNRSYREDILFDALAQLRDLSWRWKEEYNSLHPHQSLNNMSPLKYLERNQHI